MLAARWRFVPGGGKSRTKPLFGVGSGSAHPGDGEGMAARSPQHPLAQGPALHRRLGALLASSLPGKRALFSSAHPLAMPAHPGMSPGQLDIRWRSWEQLSSISRGLGSAISGSPCRCY